VVRSADRRMTSLESSSGVALSAQLSSYELEKELVRLKLLLGEVGLVPHSSEEGVPTDP
jgi:hypothetical protein